MRSVRLRGRSGSKNVWERRIRGQETRKLIQLFLGLRGINSFIINVEQGRNISLLRIRYLQRHLERFATASRRSGVLPSASEVIRILFFTLGDKGGRDYEGDLADVKDFVTWFKSLVKLENHPDRLEAIEIVERELLGSPFRSAFPRVNLPKFIFQLLLTVREPRLIQQADTELCGVVAHIVQMTKKRPVPYVELASSLIKYGKAAIGRAEIEPHPDLRQNRPSNGLGECDYVVLTSVRNSATILEPPPWGVQGLSGPEMCHALRNAGYVQVERHVGFRDNEELTWLYPGGATPEIVLRRMIEKIAARHNVFMVDDGQIVLALKLRGQIAAGSPGFHLSYVSRCRADSGHVLEIKIYAYGESCRGINIPLTSFLPHFCGFISCIDRPYRVMHR